MNTYITTMLLILISIVAIIFSLQNSAIVSVSFLFTKSDISLALVIMLSFALGFIVSLLAIMPYFSKLYFKSKQLVKTISEKERRITDLDIENEKLKSVSMTSNDTINTDNEFASDENDNSNS